MRKKWSIAVHAHKLNDERAENRRHSPQYNIPSDSLIVKLSLFQNL